MIPVSVFKDKTIALFGLGGSGIATARALVAGGARVTAFDDNPDSVARAAGEGVPTGDLHVIDWSAQDAFVLSPGVPLTHPRPHWSVDLARAAGVEIIGDVELFARERRAHAPRAPFIAITGTNGKSTTTALIAHVLRQAGRDTQMGGNIGRAILTLDPPQAERHYVVECSSYQIDLAPTLDPPIGILLNLSPDHLDRHGSFQNYAAIKERLVSRSGLAIIGVDDPDCRRIAERLEADGHGVQRISTTGSLENGFFAEGSNLMRAVDGNVEKLATLTGAGSLRGTHNAQNALAALAVCLESGLTGDEIQAGFNSFPGLAHRMEQVARRDHVLFVNDSKATNADAAERALASFERIYWIAGGLPKEGGIESLKSFFPRIAKAYLVGEAAPAFAVAIGEATTFEISGTIDKAVDHAARDAAGDPAPEAVVLFSPACSSFDQFRNFEVRGDAFREAVRSLAGAEMMGSK